MDTTTKSNIIQQQAVLQVELNKWKNLESLYTGIGSRAYDDFPLATYIMGSTPALVKLTKLTVSLRDIYMNPCKSEVSVKSYVAKLGAAPNLKSLTLIGFEISI